MSSLSTSSESGVHEDRVEGDKIILNGHGKFPKILLITERCRKLEYRIVRTKNGKYQLNK
ncbi:hypothetical protein ACFL0Q_09880 [Thermodesulfobacteriota bacterium]